MTFTTTAHEVITADNTSGGVGLTAATVDRSNAAVVAVETGQIRFTLDGTAPTSTVGLIADPGFIIYLSSGDMLGKFRAIRTGATSGVLTVVYGKADDDFKFGISANTADAAGSTSTNLTQVNGATVATGHGTAAGALRVELPTDGTGVVGLNAGSALIGKVGIDQTTPGTTNQVNMTPNITTIKASVTRPADTAAYAIGDCFSNSTSAPTSGGFTFTSASRTSGGTGRITDAVVSMSAKSAFQGEIWVFDQAATNTNDNATIALSAADALNLIGVIPFNVNDTGSVAGFSYITGLDIRFTCVGTANLRFLVKVSAAFTPANAEVLGIALKVEN